MTKQQAEGRTCYETHGERCSIYINRLTGRCDECGQIVSSPVVTLPLHAKDDVVFDATGKAICFAPKSWHHERAGEIVAYLVEAVNRHATAQPPEEPR